MGSDPRGAQPGSAWVTALTDLGISVLLAAAVALLNVPVLSSQGFVTIWFGGLAIGVLYLIPPRRWPIYLVVLTIVYGYGVLRSPHASLDAGIRTAVGLAVIVATAYYLRGRVRFPLRTVTDAWHLIGVALAVALFRGVADGTVDALVTDDLDVVSVSPLSYGLNAFVGLLLFIPLVALAGRPGEWPAWRRPDRFGLSLVVVLGLTGLVFAVFLQPAGTVPVGWAFVAVPLIATLAALFPQLSLAIGLAVTGLGMAYTTAWGRGPFAPIDPDFRTLSEAALDVQLFLAAIPATAWLLAAAMLEQTTARDAASRAAHRLTETIDSAPNPMAVWRGTGPLNTVNDAFVDFFATAEERLRSLTWSELAGAADSEGANEGTTASPTRHAFVLPDGSTRWGLVAIGSMEVEAGDEPVRIVQIVDVTREEEANRNAEAARAQARRLLDFDSVTGLHSRVWITDELDRALGRNHATPSQVAVMFIDLSAFQDVASDLSFETSDVLFHDLAETIADELPQPWLLGRFESAHVVALSADLPSRDALISAADAVLARLEQDVALHEMRISRSASIGMAVGSEGSTAQSLLRDANHALLVAKARGRSRSFLASVDIPMAPRHQLGLEHEIREGLDLRQFVLHFQPQVELRSGRIVGYEALARWQHPERGLLGPGEFIDTAEKTALIVPLGAYLLEQACLAVRNAAALPGPISVNVSAVELGNAGWAERFLDTLERYGVGMDQIAIEVTETSVLELTEEASSALGILRNEGMHISIDDFGTGYAAVRMLQQLPVTELKLDRSFVVQLVEPGHPGLALVRGIANLAQGLGLTAVAEGIETVEEADILRAAGYPIGQGYLFAKPTAELVHDVVFPLDR